MSFAHPARMGCGFSGSLPWAVNQYKFGDLSMRIIPNTISGRLAFGFAALLVFMALNIGVAAMP